MRQKSIGILCLFFMCVTTIYTARPDYEDFQQMIDLNENNWEEMLQDEWFVEFYAPWCPACRSLQPFWEKLPQLVRSLGVKVGKVDVTLSPSLSGRFLVTALPTIYHVKNGIFRQYKGSRDVESFQLFLKQKQWEKIEPVSNWKKPDSIQMTILSQLFKLSHVLKEVTSKLYEEYGIPTWGCYALFTVATILLSASLGLFLICIIDLFYPPKKSHRQTFSESKEKVEEIPNDEIEDDEQVDGEKSDNEDDDETSDGERNSHSEDNDSDEEGTETVESEKAADDQSKTQGVEENQVDDKDKSSPRELRKRKPRKAD